ncbi:unnamed protein product, partial [Brassica napus]
EPNPNPSLRKAHDEVKQEVEEDEEKKNKIETLNLSLALPDVSLSLTTSTFLNDFAAMAPLMSYSYSHPFSHSLSCSADFDCSVEKDDRIWCASEGTNGSAYSRFRPIGDDGVALARTPISTTVEFFRLLLLLFRLLLLPFRVTGSPRDGSDALQRLEEKVRRKQRRQIREGSIRHRFEVYLLRRIDYSTVCNWEDGV